MTPEELARLHALCFTDAPRPWSAAEFAAMLGYATTLVAERPLAFAVGRAAGPEAELLTIAVHPAARRQGLARALIAEIEGAARAQGARELYLEVAETNAAARALYRAAGFRPLGRRPGYYRRAGPAIAALVLGKAL